MNKTTYNFPVELQPYSVGYKVVRTDTNALLSIVTKKYNLITHKEAVEILEKCLSQLNMDTQQTNVFLYGEHQSSLFVEYQTKKNVKFENDAFKIKVYLKNSYNGLSRLRIGVSLLRLVCKNGLYLPDKFASTAIKHLGHSSSNRIVDFLNNAETVFLKFTSIFQHLLNSNPLQERVLVNKEEYEEVLSLYTKHQRALGTNAYSQYQAYTDFITNSTSGSKKEKYQHKIIPLILKQIEIENRDNERNSIKSL